MQAFRQNRNRHFDLKAVADILAAPEIASECRAALGLPHDAELAVWRSMVWWSYPGIAFHSLTDHVRHFDFLYLVGRR